MVVVVGGGFFGDYCVSPDFYFWVWVVVKVGLGCDMLLDFMF